MPTEPMLELGDERRDVPALGVPIHPGSVPGNDCGRNGLNDPFLVGVTTPRRRLDVLGRVAVVATDERAEIDVRTLAPEALASFDAVLAAMPGAAPARSVELARRRIASLLVGPEDSLPSIAEIDTGTAAALSQWPTSEHFDGTDRAALELAEQFIVDVAATTDELRARCFGALGDSAFPTVQAIYVLDHGLRVRAALRQIFGTSDGAARPADTGTGDAPTPDLWSSLDGWMQSVARLQALDPVTTELVRLRGARAHDCRLCRSRRFVQAVRAGADESFFDQIDDYERSDLSERHKVALRLCDAMLWNPASFSDGLVEQVHDEYTPAESLEVVLDVARNAANKIAVVFGADAPVVTEGVELYDVDDLGNVLHGAEVAGSG